MNLLLGSVFLLMSLSYVLSMVECQRLSNKTNIRHASQQLQSMPKRSTAARENYLAGSSILFAILKKLNESYVTDTCNEHLQMVYEGINRKEVWAMKGISNDTNNFCGWVSTFSFQFSTLLHNLSRDLYLEIISFLDH